MYLQIPKEKDQAEKMLLLLKLILLTSIIVLSFKIACSKDMILEKFGLWVEVKVNGGNKIFEVLQCPFCMGSVFSMFGFASAFGLGVLRFFDLRLLVYYPLCVMGCCIVSGFTWVAYQTLNSIKDNKDWGTKYYDNAQKYYYNLNKEIKKNNGKPE